MFFKLSGSLFHKDGPETEKERGPKLIAKHYNLFVRNEHLAFYICIVRDVENSFKLFACLYKFFSCFYVTGYEPK